jgi:hypothetical protein
MSRIFGAEMTKGWLLVIQDDMYACANTPDVLLQNWESILEKLSRNGLTILAVKTYVCPTVRPSMLSAGNGHLGRFQSQPALNNNITSVPLHLFAP